MNYSFIFLIVAIIFLLIHLFFFYTFEYNVLFNFSTFVETLIVNLTLFFSLTFYGVSTAYATFDSSGYTFYFLSFIFILFLFYMATPKDFITFGTVSFFQMWPIIILLVSIVYASFKYKYEKKKKGYSPEKEKLQKKTTRIAFLAINLAAIVVLFLFNRRILSEQSSTIMRIVHDVLVFIAIMSNLLYLMTIIKTKFSLFDVILFAVIHIGLLVFFIVPTEQLVGAGALFVSGVGSAITLIKNAMSK